MELNATDSLIQHTKTIWQDKFTVTNFENAHKKTVVKMWIFENFVNVASRMRKILTFCGAIRF